MFLEGTAAYVLGSVDENQARTLSTVCLPARRDFLIAFQRHLPIMWSHQGLPRKVNFESPSREGVRDKANSVRMVSQRKKKESDMQLEVALAD